MQSLVRLVSIVFLAVGVGLLIYGLLADAQGYRAPAGLDLLSSPSECAAWGGGLAVAGGLLLALFGRRSGAERSR